MLIAVSLRAFASGKTLPQNEPREVKRETRIPAPRQARACLEMQHADDYFRQTNSDRLLARVVPHRHLALPLQAPAAGGAGVANTPGWYASFTNKGGGHVG
jgi:hypothetical protein